jgi:hypothetical protein
MFHQNPANSLKVISSNKKLVTRGPHAKSNVRERAPEDSISHQPNYRTVNKRTAAFWPTMENV